VEDVIAGWEIVEGDAPVTGVPPVRILAVQLNLEANFFRRAEAEGCVMNLEVAASGG
jgi:hypothetical protein